MRSFRTIQRTILQLLNQRAATSSICPSEVARALDPEPYKSELLPLWRFSTPMIARRSAKALWAAFVAYRRQGDGVGMDMARKFLQMGFTRARRYANHRSGRKYDVTTGAVLPVTADPLKAAAADEFYEVWQRAERDRSYKKWRAAQAR